MQNVFLNLAALRTMGIDIKPSIVEGLLTAKNLYGLLTIVEGLYYDDAYNLISSA